MNDLALDMEEDFKEGAIKPSFDGRMQYHKIVGGHLLEISRAQGSGDHYTWLRLLYGLHALTHPYCKKEDMDEVKKDLDALYNRMVNVMGLRNSSKIWNQNNLSFDKKLLDLTSKINFAIRHLLLTTSEDTGGEFTEEEFYRQSDL